MNPDLDFYNGLIPIETKMLVNATIILIYIFVNYL